MSSSYAAQMLPDTSPNDLHVLIPTVVDEYAHLILRSKPEPVHA